MLNVGDRVTHRDNPELGIGRVESVDGRTVVVAFPSSGTELRFGVSTGALIPIGDSGVVAADLAPVERLARGEVDPVAAFALRLDALHLARERESDDLGSFLGGRIRLFPHQLDVALKATRQDPVRWLLADEVGLGKTVEACLIANHLIRARRTERTLVVAPETLTVQWLGELWRKYHQVFVLLDPARLQDVEKDFGAGFNPFDVHRQAVVGLQTLAARPRLTEQAVDAGIDLLIVDEAHHLRRPPGHPGEAAYRAIAPIAGLGRHVLLLTATPLEDDAHGFFRLLQLLRPDAFPDDDFAARLARRDPLPPCASSTRRADIGGLPPRAPAPVELPGDRGWEALAAVERALAARPADGELARRERVRLLRAAHESGPSLLAKLPSADAPLRALATAWRDADPRVLWLARAGAAWKARGEKTLVFAAGRETVDWLRSELSRRAQLRTGVFHEDLSPAQRDIEVAQFRLPSGASMLLATECGGEGRNFEFCHRLVLFDLPWSPSVLEQRIGRLDRIGRDRPVEIVYVRPPSGLGASIAALHESIGVLREPLGGLERELAIVEEAIETAALAAPGSLAPSFFDDAVREARAARDRMREAAYHELFRDPYHAADALRILARIPDDLEDLTRDFALGACEALGLHVEDHRGGIVHSVEFGNRAKVDSLPGIPGNASFLGSFDRAWAVADESIDFFASGHPLIEGLLAEIEDGGIGRTAILNVDLAGEGGLGLLALYRTPRGFEAVCVDAAGRSRPAWADALTSRPLRTRRVKADALVRQPGWEAGIRTMAEALPEGRRPVAVAAVIVGR
jgi:ATP-dependent helicase HepA